MNVGATAAPGDPVPELLDRPIDELLAHERVVSLYWLAPAAIVAGLVYCPLFVLAMSVNGARAAPLAWLAVRTLCGLARLWDIRQFKRSAPGPSESARWRGRGLWMLAIDAASWAAIAPVFLDRTTGLAQALVLTTVFVVAAIGTMTLFANATAVAIFATGMLSPAVAMLALRDDVAGWAGAGGGVIYLFVLLNEAGSARARWLELQRLRFDHARIARDSRRLQGLAEHASAAKSRFLATISHELRTPLNGIMGMTQMLLATARDPPVRDRLDAIAESARHLRGLISDLVDLSRIEAGRLAIADAPFDPAAALRDVIELHQPAARAKALVLRIDHDPRLPTLLRGDVVRCKQVLHNLIGNAIKFTAEGAVSVQAQWRDGTLRCVVRDTGPGVEPARRRTIFVAFEQGESRRAGAGLGLGLTISRELARAMGGDVVLLDEPGPGAAFAFTMRAAPVDCARDDASTAEPAAPDRPPCLAGHALLVEDNPVNAEVARAMLEHLGLRVSVVGDGAQALARRGEAFDVVLMDCEMPVLDGLETARRWRAGERDDASARHVPMVALTASAVQGDRDRCLNAGMDDYLAKPFELNELAAVLQRVLQRGEAPPR